jgi:hypothetical protein
MVSIKHEFEDHIEWRNQYGVAHNEGGPAIEWSNGDKMWLWNGQYHRIGGPAIAWMDGHKEWWVEDNMISKHIWDFFNDENTDPDHTLIYVPIR